MPSNCSEFLLKPGWIMWLAGDLLYGSRKVNRIDLESVIEDGYFYGNLELHTVGPAVLRQVDIKGSVRGFTVIAVGDDLPGATAKLFEIFAAEEAEEERLRLASAESFAKAAQNRAREAYWDDYADADDDYDDEDWDDLS